MSEQRLWNVYLSGEIHTQWRDEIQSICEEKRVPVRLTGPELDHETSDNCGEVIQGAEPSDFWKDHKAAKINTRLSLLLSNNAVEAGVINMATTSITPTVCKAATTEKLKSNIKK